MNRASTALTSLASHASTTSTTPACFMHQPKLHAKLRITPEQPYLDGRHDHSLWISLQISCDVQLPPSEDVAHSPALDLAIILDNSAYCSHEALRRGSEIAVQLARLLSGRDDRVALLHTYAEHPSREDNESGCLFLPFDFPDTQAIYGKLHEANKSQVHSNTIPDCLDLSGTLAAAFRLLDMSKTGPDNKTQRKGHVVILSSNPSACMLEGLSDYPVDIVHTGLVPWKRECPQETSWNVAASPLVEPQLYDILEVLIQQARTTLPACPISNLQTKLQLAGGCIVEKQIGQTSRHTLQPGQVHHLLVKVQIPASVSARRPKGTTRSDHEISRLESYLGIANSDVFSVTVSYSHSSQSERLEDRRQLQEECRLIRDDPESVWTGRSELERADEIAKARVEVCKQLIYTIAEEASTPDQALKELDRTFAGWDFPAQISHYLARARRELEYQVQINDRYGDPARESRLAENFWMFNTVSGSYDPPTKTRASDENLLKRHTPALSYKHHLDTILSEEEPSEWHHSSFAGFERLGFDGSDSPRPSFEKDRNDSNSTIVVRQASTSPLGNTSGDSRATDQIETTAPPAVSPVAPTESNVNDNGGPSTDEAHRIWRLMRTASAASTSRGTARRSLETPFEGDDEDDEVDDLGIKNLALRNKRSIGADTLRSLSLDLRRGPGKGDEDGKEGRSMPWL
ncbi:MAG: hypothetical protein M1828_002580 [Chrysothrix sp. TS-e1954]|nr:MAG: hypothetical protein M1828_002580 [Chrysothrix sp. TS-e1954]